MIELTTNHDIFDLPQNYEAVCVTTNGMVKNNGNAVMGKGIAKQADVIFNLSSKLGSYLQKYGNRVFKMGKYKRGSQLLTVITFPTKNDWRDKSSISLIEQSCKQLVEVCNKFGIAKCYLPPVGCGCGGLDYNATVKPILTRYLDDRFIIVLKN